MIELFIPGVPIAQPRTKATIRGGHAGVFTPTKTSTGKSNGIAEYKAAIRHAWAEATSMPPLEGPVKIDVVMVFSRPSAMIWKTRAMRREWHTKKPDADNVLKAVKDALMALAWRDDSQVCLAVVRKLIASGDEQPHTIIRVSPCEREPYGEPA